MKTIISGWIEESIPKINRYINNEGILVFKKVNQLEFIVDTGFHISGWHNYSISIGLIVEFLV